MREDGKVLETEGDVSRTALAMDSEPRNQTLNLLKMVNSAYACFVPIQKKKMGKLPHCPGTMRDPAQAPLPHGVPQPSCSPTEPTASTGNPQPSSSLLWLILDSLEDDADVCSLSTYQIWGLLLCFFRATFLRRSTHFLG